LKNEEVLNKVEKFKKALKELNEFLNETQKAAERFIGSIPGGTSLVYTWVEGNGGKYWYWYIKGSGISIYVGSLGRVSPGLIKKVKDLQGMGLKVREALAVLCSYVELAGEIDWEALQRGTDRIRQRVEEAGVEVS